MLHVYTPIAILSHANKLALSSCYHISVHSSVICSLRRLCAVCCLWLTTIVSRTLLVSPFPAAMSPAVFPANFCITLCYFALSPASSHKVCTSTSSEANIRQPRRPCNACGLNCNLLLQISILLLHQTTLQCSAAFCNCCTCVFPFYFIQKLLPGCRPS